MDENTETNEWLSLSHSETIADVVSHFRSENKEFLFPKKGETFIVRLLGEGISYYRAYLDQRLRWSLYLNTDEIRRCLNGNIKSIISITKRILSSDNVAKKYVIVNDNLIMLNCIDGQISVETRELLNIITFLQKCLSGEKALWSRCVIFNAYVKNGPRMNGCVKPVVISRAMVYGMIKEKQDVININSSNISGVNSYDLTLSREQVKHNYGYSTATQVPIVLKISSTQSLLDIEDIISISRQGFYDIPKFVKANNADSLSVGGFVHRPSDDKRDLFSTNKFVEDAIERQVLELESEHSVVENELCNLPPKLNGTDFRGGPISSLEIL